MAHKRYVIWDEVSPVVTPSGELFTAEQWMNRYPMAQLDTIELVLSGGVINGALCFVYQEMIDRYEKYIDFSVCETKQECLDLIEAFEDEMNQPSTEPSTDERIAAALEAQVMLQMDDVAEEEIV